MKRCFVALRITDATREALAEVQDELRRLPRSAARRLRPVKARNLHLTVQFLGPTPDDQVEAIGAALQSVAGGTPRPGGIVTGLGAFPTAERPRAVFGAIAEGRDAITELAAAVEGALEPLGFPPEKRPRVPHVTLARVEGARRNGPLSDWLQAAEPVVYGPIDDSALVLYESQLDPGGSIYSPLAVMPLGAT